MRLLTACFILAFSGAVTAQSDYPNRPLRLVVTVPPGGAADFTSERNRLREEMAKWAPVVKQAGVKLD